MKPRHRLAACAAWIRQAGAHVLRLLVLGLLCGLADAAPETLPLYTAYADAPLDAHSPGNLTQRLARWLSERSGGRYSFVATQLPRDQLDALIARPGWRGVVAWGNPRWFDDPARQRFLWTPAFMQDADLVVSQRRHAVEYLDEGRSLDGLALGAIIGHRLPDLDWLIASGRVHRVDSPREIDSLRLLQQGRVDVALVQAISMAHFRQELPDLDGWLYVARQPRDTYGRHLFTAAGDPALRDHLAREVAVLAQDSDWRQVLPQPPRQLRLVSFDQLGSAYSQALRRLLDQACERAGLSYSLSMLPAERVVTELRAGRIDGDVARSVFFADAVPGLLRVGPSHSTVYILAVTRRGGPHPARWEDLAGLSVALPRGLKTNEARLRGMPRREVVDGVDACVRMVAQGHVDVCVEPGYSSTEWAGRQHTGVALEAAVLDTRDAYLWLRPGLEDEARRLGEALAAMTRSGELAGLMGSFRPRPAAASDAAPGR